MAAPRFRSFDEFWPHYLGEHRKAGCRLLHYLGALCALSALVHALAAADWRGLWAVPVLAYGCAWLGHLLIERNRPATWSYVGWSLRGELRMLTLALCGRLRRELAATARRPTIMP